MTSQSRKISMFATENDTSSWVVCIDGFFQKFDTKEDAIAVYNLVEDIEDSAHGSIEILPPQTGPIIDFRGNDMTKSKISENKEIDIVGYIAKSKNKLEIASVLERRQYQKWTGKYFVDTKRSIQEKLADKKFFSVWAIKE